uniref:Uncharacterized protein n=1 Tax=Rhizophora mucronata TaxID=61149 RepID=A0A2P2MSK3_RHIMU
MIKSNFETNKRILRTNKSCTYTHIKHQGQIEELT